MDYRGWFEGWFDNRTEFMYSYPYPTGSSAKPLPYPWTRLGYTYDWGSLSEFVVHGNRVDEARNPKTIAVGIKSVSTTEEYFARW